MKKKKRKVEKKRKRRRKRVRKKAKKKRKRKVKNKVLYHLYECFDTLRYKVCHSFMQKYTYYRILMIVHVLCIHVFVLYSFQCQLCNITFIYNSRRRTRKLFELVSNPFVYVLYNKICSFPRGLQSTNTRYKETKP